MNGKALQVCILAEGHKSVVRLCLHWLYISRQQREGLGHGAGARRRQPLKALMEALPQRCCHSHFVKNSAKAGHIQVICYNVTL